MDVNKTIDEPRFAIHRTFGETLPLPPGKKFDIFFSYRNVHRDMLWVKRVIQKLETECGYICCDHERDFLPGTDIIDNMKDGVNNSEKVVVVFSKEAIKSGHVLLEAKLAYHLSLETRKNLVIPVLLEDCDVPKEYMLLTYIDAREGVEEATWWSKLLKSLESTGEASRTPFYIEGKNVAADKTFAITQLCSIETKYNFLRCRIEANSKYIPEQLRREAPVELIRATNKDLLQSPEVVCRQKMSSFARISVVIGYLLFLLFLFYLVLGIYFFIYPSETYETGPFIIACIFLFGPCYFTWRVYVTVPVELIRATNNDFLQSPEVVYRQTVSRFARISVVIGYLTFLLFLWNLVLGIYFFIYASETYETKWYFIACLFLLCTCGSLYFTWRVFITVPVELIRATNNDFLQSPGMVWRQTVSRFARILVVIGYLIFLLFLWNLVHGIYFFIYPSETYETIWHFVACLLYLCTCGPLYYAWRIFITVPVELIRATNNDFLQSPRMVWRQTVSCFARILVVIGYLIFLLFLWNLILGIYFFIYPSETIETKWYFVAYLLHLCTCGPLYYAWRIFITPIEQNLNSVHKSIIDYNKKLSKYGVMATVVPGYMWKTASLIFYKCRFELCKEYVIRHLVKEWSTNKTEHKDIPDSEQMSASDDGSSLLSGTGKLLRRRGVKQSIPIVSEINPMMADVAEDVSDVAEDKPLLSNQGTENLDYEKKALELLMSCTPEYLDLVYANKLKLPREDRHGIEFMCLCQYLEEANEGFREAVKRAKSMRANVEANYQDEANKHLKNFLL